MYIVRIIGGLGNQMFSYAAGYAVAKKYGKELKVFKYEYRINGWRYELDTLNLTSSEIYKHIPYKLNWQAFRRRVANTLNHRLKLHLRWGLDYQKTYDYGVAVCEKKHEYEPIPPLSEEGNFMQYGYFQSYKYFDEYRQDIIDQFRPNFKLSSETVGFISNIQDVQFAVSVHIRRGDYVKLGWSIPDDYYLNTMKTIYTEHPEATFFIFSDDIEYAQKMLKDSPFQCLYMIHPKQVNSFEDIWAMSKCQCNIIANSTFSFWGAYLNVNDNKKVYAPSKIFALNNSILPEDWNVVPIE